MTDAQLIEAMRRCRAARMAFIAAGREEERIREDNISRLKEAELASRIARDDYHEAMKIVHGAWSADDQAAPLTIPTTPEQPGKNGQPPLDIHDVLASGVIPGAPVVDPILATPQADGE